MLRFLLLVFLCIPFDARADCAFQEIQDTKIHVLDSVAARHVEDGVLRGCILKLSTEDAAGESMQAYTRYDFICDLPKDELLKVSFRQSCCDTGDHGDFTCGVKPRNPLLALSYDRIWLSIAPSAPDRRAIPNLVTMLEKAKRWGSANLVDEILRYHKAFPEEIHALRPKFEHIRSEAAKAGHNNNPKFGEMARLMRDLYGDTINSDELLEMDLAIFTNGIYSMTDAERAALTRITTAKNLTVEQFARLVERLRNTTDADRILGLEALAHFPQYLLPYLNEIYSYLPDENYYGSSRKPEETALREALLAEWRNLVCLAFPPRAGENFHQVVFTKNNYGSDPLLVTCSADAE